MELEDEKQRLERVYRGYETEDAVGTRWSSANLGNTFNFHSWRRRLVQVLKDTGNFPLTNHRILEIGCGAGDLIVSLKPWGAMPENLVGIDLREDGIEQARRKCPGVDFRQADAASLDFNDASFDLVFSFTVFTSILDETIAQNVAREVARVLRPGGAVVWHDFRRDNPWNPHVRAVPQSKIRALFPGFALRLRSETLLPPLARRLGRLTPVLYPPLAAIPFLRTHLLGLLIKPSEATGI